MNKTLLTLAALTLGTSMALADTPPSVYDPVTGVVMPIDQIDFSQMDAAEIAAVIAEMQAMRDEHRAQAEETMRARMQEMTPEARAEMRAAMQQEMQDMQDMQNMGQNAGAGGGMGGGAGGGMGGGAGGGMGGGAGGGMGGGAGGGMGGGAGGGMGGGHATN